MRTRVPSIRWMWLAGGLLCGAGLAAALHAEDEAPSTNTRSTQTVSGAPSPASAPSPGASSGRSSGGPVTMKTLEARLNDILSKQQTILDRLEEVKAELQIVKVRATVR